MKIKSIFQVLAIFCFAGTLVSCNSDSAPKKDRIIEIPEVNEKVKGLEFIFKPKIDVLFVVDNSTSMNGYQIRLAENIDQFVKNFVANPFVDFHFAVTTSAMAAVSDTGTWAGRFHRRQFVTKTTPDLIETLKGLLRVGTTSSDNAMREMFFDSLIAALTPPRIENENRNFLREDAMLVSVFLTDTEDQSMRYNWETAREKLLELKAGQREKVTAFAAVIPSSYGSSTPRDCLRDPIGGGIGLPVKIEQFVSAMGGRTFDICGLFGGELSSIGSELVRRLTNEIPLRQDPVVSSIKVRYGRQSLPEDFWKGWSYNSGKVAIRLGPDIEFTETDPNAELSIFFRPYKTN